MWPKPGVTAVVIDSHVGEDLYTVIRRILLSRFVWILKPTQWLSACEKDINRRPPNAQYWNLRDKALDVSSEHQEVW